MLTAAKSIQTIVMKFSLNVQGSTLTVNRWLQASENSLKQLWASKHFQRDQKLWLKGISNI